MLQTSARSLFRKNPAKSRGLMSVVILFVSGDGLAFETVCRHGLLGYHGKQFNPAVSTESEMAERSEYRHFVSIATRWRDNDIYGHVNNIEYYSYFDTAINTYLIAFGGLDIHGGMLIGVCAEWHCKFLAEFSFPETVQAGLRVEHLGTSSVRYGLGLFREAEPAAVAEGWFVHVFVDREHRRPSPLTPDLRAALQALSVERPS